MAYEIVWEPRGVVKRFYDHVTGLELLQAGAHTQASIRFDELRYVVNDFLDATGCSVTPDDIDEIAAIDQAASATNPHIRIIVIATHSYILAMAHHYASSPLNVYPTRVFATRAAGRAWLDVSPAQCPSSLAFK